MLKEKSCGIIPVKFRKGQPLFLLIQHHAGHWGLPKGHKNPGESDEETAKRELKEETGLELEKLLKKPYLEKYVYRRSGKIFRKKVVYFVGITKPGQVKIQEEEIKDFAWATYDSAYEKLNFPEIRLILQKAKRSIKPLSNTSKIKKPKARKAE